ncbi:MAG: hypothetical protein M0Q13_08500 [Methanothrix sp.]|jgi:hypothetical protein|nr:hypothetical protein [Methanothrix sp.]
MAAVLKLLRPRKRATLPGTFRKDGRALELQTAKEILAEVFCIRISEVDEMIENRSLDCHECRKEKGLWPQEFQLEV